MKRFIVVALVVLVVLLVLVGVISRIKSGDLELDLSGAFTVPTFSSPAETPQPQPTATPVSDPDVVYRKGDKGEQIQAIQSWLFSWGLYGESAKWDDEVDGVYGSNTMRAVKRLQQLLGIEVTGVIDQETYDQFIWLIQGDNASWIGK